MNPNATAQAQARRDEFIRVLTESGSAVQARRVVGVAGRTVRKWMEDEAFLDQYNDAVETAQDAIRRKVREMALAGSEPMLALSLKVIEPALRPAATNVAVAVGGRATVVDRSPEAIEALAAKLERARAEAELRGQSLVDYLLGRPPDDVVDVEALPAPACARPDGEAIDVEVVPTQPDDGKRAVEAPAKPDWSELL